MGESRLYGFAMRRIQLYFLLFLATAILTPTIFWLELPGLLERPYALHWFPEVLCLFFFGLLLTRAALSQRDQHPHAQRIIKHVFIAVTLFFGFSMLVVAYVVLGYVGPYQFTFFLWGTPVLLGYVVETRILGERER